MNKNSAEIFKVSEKRKKIWSIQLEMVEIFDKVCKKYKLKYFLSGGTLLGAIRHNGYIPWDDDIDIMMPRKDYESFLNIASDEFDKKRFFVQSSRTERLYYNGHIQIRNNETTCFLKDNYYDLKLGKNLGIWIDIFPYDLVKNEKDRKNRKIIKQKSKYFFYLNGLFPKTKKDLLKRLICKVFFINEKKIEKAIKKIDSIASKTDLNDDNVALVSFAPGYSKNVWKKELLDKAIMHKFENLVLPIPEQFDLVLKREYGDYMVIPKQLPESMHGNCFFDTNKSYKEYQNISESEFEKLFENFII